MTNICKVLNFESYILRYISINMSYPVVILHLLIQYPTFLRTFILLWISAGIQGLLSETRSWGRESSEMARALTNIVGQVPRPPDPTEQGRVSLLLFYFIFILDLHSYCPFLFFYLPVYVRARPVDTTFSEYPSSLRTADLGPSCHL